MTTLSKDKLEALALALRVFICGVHFSDSEGMLATFGHEDLDKIWTDLEEWERDDYRLAVEYFIKEYERFKLMESKNG